ncbi:MAG: NUDIX domain-containing protein [Thermoplasmata archaeon]
MYVIAFKDDRFVMVRHRNRKWEMPGGRLLEKEGYEEGALREFLEETGMELRIVGEIPIDVDGGKVFVGVAAGAVDDALSKEISEVRTFEELPEDLSFPLVEYRTMLARARTLLETFKKRKAIGRSTSPLTSKCRRR